MVSDRPLLSINLAKRKTTKTRYHNVGRKYVNTKEQKNARSRLSTPNALGPSIARRFMVADQPPPAGGY